MSTTRRNTSQRLTLVILVLLSVTAITLDYRGDASKAIRSIRNVARDGISPIQRVLADALHPIGDLFSGAVNYGSAVSENEQLRNELGTLRREALENQTAEHQLQELLNEENLPYIQNLPTLVAEVVAGPSSNFEATFEIDRGTSSGVGVGMPVVDGAGLIGTITAAGSSTSVVEAITDPGTSFGVSFGTPALYAVAGGRGTGYPLSLSNVTASTPVTDHELVYSSGIAGASLPAGIPVGTVSSVHYTRGTLTKSVLVTPVADLSGLSTVTVILWFPAP
ncbi:MAG: rod shape-determining protein MreC [Acidimicrobiales bacterium]